MPHSSVRNAFIACIIKNSEGWLPGRRSPEGRARLGLVSAEITLAAQLDEREHPQISSGFGLSERVQAYGYGFPALVLLIDLAAGKPAPPLMTIPGLAIVLLASLVVQRGAIREFRD